MANHLVYHLWPLQSPSDNWRWNLRQLRRRLGLFDGARHLAVVTGPDAATVDEVRAELGGERFDLLVTENVPALREMATFPALLESLLPSLAPGDRVFVAQGKGVRPRQDAAHEAAVRRWAEVMYETCLDYFPLVCEQLGRHPCTGSFKRAGKLFGRESRCAWHYSGSFYWLAADALLSRDWRAALEHFWGGIETFPGRLAESAEAGLLFHEEPGWKMNLYSPEYWERKAEPKYERWRAEHRHQYQPPEAA